jgi:enoyl-CoA hydratase
MTQDDPRLNPPAHIRVSIEPPVAEVAFNRPEKKNAFVSFDTFGPIRDVFEAIGEMDDIKVVVFRGVGDSFSTGGDVSTIGHMYFDDGVPPKADEGRKRITQRRHLRIDEAIFKAWEAIAHSQKVVIAEGKGHVLGLALDLFLASDIAICSDDAVLGYPPGRMIGYGGVNPLFWMFKMGPALHAEMTMMGRYVSAAEALQRGLINRVVSRAQLEDTVEAACRAVCSVPADALAIGKLNRRLAYEALGARASGLHSIIAHSMGVQLRPDEGEWSLMKARNQLGAKGAWQERDLRFDEALAAYESGEG